MALSRYRNVNVVNIPATPRYYETINVPDRDKLDQISVIKVRAARFDRLDQLAYKHLGSGEYWWVIAVMNDLEWAYDFEEGDILRIPLNVEDVLKLI